jgi:predicted phosphodiesterase
MSIARAAISAAFLRDEPKRMRVFALSDIHIDYAINADWIGNLSTSDYRDDVLILAGDVSDSLQRLNWCFEALTARFKKVLYVPGNHDLWVVRDGSREKTSLHKFQEVSAAAESNGISMQPYHDDGISIVPLLGWYDYSFGQPSDELKSIWLDYQACDWQGLEAKEITSHFAAFNDHHSVPGSGKVITFSHFLPRIDVMPTFIPANKRILYPVLGAARLDRQLRALKPSIHVYGHSHVNRNVTIDGVTYINNAFGYPAETRITSKRLLCIHEG